MGEWLASYQLVYSSPHSSVSIICMGGPGKLVNTALVWILRNVLLVAVGQST